MIFLWEGTYLNQIQFAFWNYPFRWLIMKWEKVLKKSYHYMIINSEYIAKRRISGTKKTILFN